MIYELYYVIFIIGIVSMLYAFLYYDSNNYTHIIAGYISVIIFFFLGYNMYIGVDVDNVIQTTTYTAGNISDLISVVSTNSYQYDWMGLLFIVIGVIMALYSSIQVINETGVIISVLERKKR